MSKTETKMGLLPIMNPLFNLREITKQMSLLEDHLNNPRKRCHDCIRKHFLTIEALFEEAVSLDNKLEYHDILEGKAQEIRDLQGGWLDCLESSNMDSIYCEIAQGLRTMRKEFAPLCFDVRKMAFKNTILCEHRKRAMINRIVLSTLSEQEKDEREVTRLVKPSPKKKPSRKDRTRRRIKIEDKDLQGLDKGQNGDPDLKK